MSNYIPMRTFVSSAPRKRVSRSRGLAKRLSASQAHLLQRRAQLSQPQRPAAFRSTRPSGYIMSLSRPPSQALAHGNHPTRVTPVTLCALFAGDM